MASYGSIYEFAFDSQNGADILIVISKKNYIGEVTRRPLGRAPILKRENNGRIYGTSLEIYAECKVDGEYADFYTSSADEFKVEVWKDQTSIWTGFITPELYSEPDVAPPYDVQIIATDGIGELKNYTFATKGVNSIYGHLRTMLDHVGHSRPLALISNLTYSDANEQSDPVDFFSIRVDLEHEVGETCYDVLQRLLASFNAGITLYNDDWVIFRQTDFIHMAERDWMQGVYSNGLSALFGIVDFGSMSDTDWWPIGQMSTSIEPAKKNLVVEAPNAYRANALSPEWAVNNGASYNESEKAYVLPDEGSYIIQTIDFGGGEVGYRLGLRIRAMNVGEGDEDQSLGVILKIDGHVAGGYYDYYLLQHNVTDRGPGSYYWDTREGWIEGELAVPTSSDTSNDAQDIDIIIPLYDTRKPGVNTRSWIYARSIEITIFNPEGTHDIYVYDVSLVKYEQTEGYQANVNIDNAAREPGDTVTTSLSDASKAPTEGYLFQSGIPLFPDKDSAIRTWKIGNSSGKEYLQLMAEDYAMTVALPRMEYRGTLNVSLRTIPFLFRREGTYYFPRTYSYDLLYDELEVELISIPAAEVASTSVVVSQMTQSEGSFSSAGSGGGGGVGSGVDLSNYYTKQHIDENIGNLDERISFNRTEIDSMAELREWYAKVGKLFGFDEHGIYTDENFRTSRQLSGGGAAEEQEEGEGGTTTGEYKMYHHTQGTAAKEWRVEHGLGKFPNVRIVDSNKMLCYGDVKYINDAVLTITFGAAEKGDAYCD